MKFKNYLLLTVFYSTFAITTKSQIWVKNPSEFEKVKKGITYVVINDATSEQVKEYMNVFRNHWTLSKIEFINYESLSRKILVPGNSFIEISNQSRTVDMAGSNESVFLVHNYLDLYLYDTVYSQGWKKASSKIGKIEIAKIELYTAPEFEVLKYDNKFNFDGSDFIYNWGPGILKNYIQTLTTFITNKEVRPLGTELINVNELKNLKEMELVVPDYVLIKDKYSKKKYNVTKLFQNYQYKYRIETSKDLNEKILNDKKGFYYLQYVQTTNWKFISIINSLTGEIIYSKFFDKSYAIKSKDFKFLGKKIQEIP